MPVQLATRNANGPVSWAVTAGLLPPGLNLGADTGVIDGFPTVAGVFPFTVQATDANRLPDVSDDVIDTQDLTITISPDQVLDVDPDVVGAETQYTAITNTQFTASGGPGPFTFTVKVGDALPPGLVLSSTGLLSGVPLVGGVYVFDVEARTASPPFFGATTISMTVNAITPIAITNPGALGVEQVGVAITPIVLAATNGVPPYTWTIAAGNLPPGLSMNSSGVISGTPTTNGNYNFTVRAQDFPPSFDTDELALLIPVYTVINAPAQPAVPQGWTTEAFVYQPVIADGLGPTFTWTLQAGSLPTGLGFNAATGEITGTPTLVENQAFTLRATDDGTAEFVDIAITIDVAMRVTIGAHSPDLAIVGDAYSFTFVETGGLGPFIWSIIVPDLPSGLSLNANTGEVSGTTTLEQTKAFTIQVLDTATGDVAKLPTSIESSVGNSWASLIASLNTSHYWPMDEVSGDYIDAGVVGGFDLTLNSPTDAWRRAPSLGPRLSPVVYGLWKNADSSLPKPSSASAPATVGNDTGGIGIWFTWLDDTFQSTAALISVAWENNSGLVMKLEVSTSGQLRFELLGSARTYILSTGAGFVVPGETHWVWVEQPADGNGARMYVDGVDLGLTPSFSGSGVDIDSWVSEVLVGFNATDVTVGALESVGFDGSYRAILGGPGLNVNTVYGASNVAALYAGALSDQPAGDYHEWVKDMGWFDQSLKYWGGHWNIPGAGVGASGGIGGIDDRHASFDSGTSIPNDPDDDGSGLEIVSSFDRFKQVYGSSNPAYFAIGAATNWEPTVNRRRYTIAADVTVNGVGDGDRKIIFTFGTSQANSMELGVVGSALGWQVFFRAFTTASGEVYRVLSGIVQLGGTWFGQIAVRQSGSGPELFVNGVKMSNTPVIATATNVSFATYGDSSGSRWGGEQGSQTIDNWEPGHLHAMHGFDKALTEDQMLELYNAGRGVVSGPTFLTDITEYIDSLNPTHRYKMDDASSPILDSGSGTAVDLEEVLNPIYDNEGPDDSTTSIDGNGGTDYFRHATADWGTPSTGTIVCFVKDVTSSMTFLSYSNTVNEDNTFVFGMGPQGIAPANRIGAIFTVTGPTDYRYWVADDIPVGSWNTDGTWHVVAFVQTGSGMRINIDGTEAVVTEVQLGGSNPPSSSWFADANDANSRAVLMNARHPSVSGNFQGDMSEVLIFDNVQLTEEEIRGFVDRISN